MNRRTTLLSGLAVAGGLALPSIARAQEATQRNIAAFSMLDWRDHFDALGVAAIVADTNSRALFFWNSDGADVRVYPTSVPISKELGSGLIANR